MSRDPLMFCLSTCQRRQGNQSIPFAVSPVLERGPLLRPFQPLAPRVLSVSFLNFNVDQGPPSMRFVYDYNFKWTLETMKDWKEIERKRKVIPFLQSYARIERQKAIEDFDRKMKLWRWIHDPNSDINHPPDLDADENEKPAKLAKPAKPVKPRKPGKQRVKEAKELKEPVRRRRGPRPRNVEPLLPRPSPPAPPAPSTHWRNRYRREESKRVSKPSRIMRERDDLDELEDWTPEMPETQKGHKRVRLTYSEAQVDVLRDAFDMEHYASRDLKEKLAHRTGLTVAQVNKWFENRRKRERDERKAKTC
ncbi:hypothetical protein L596_002461 [Steinernema carpocapsae]|uniref:Homeobox domain-containing protein n=1 Tax=Steinernema carpocapsae TaxID=34508 RepID=A0A4U8UPU4_STECR|nr:hypothetical protein L596_002461 [Steinernema carpocapsae]